MGDRRFEATSEELASLNEEFLLARNEAIIACDASRRVTLLTPEAARLSGLGPEAHGRPLEGRALGIAPATLDEWLDAATKAGAPIERGVASVAGGHRVRIESLAGSDGSRLGWLLTWIAPHEAARLPDA